MYVFFIKFGVDLHILYRFNTFWEILIILEILVNMSLSYCGKSNPSFLKEVSLKHRAYLYGLIWDYRTAGTSQNRALPHQ